MGAVFTEKIMIHNYKNPGCYKNSSIVQSKWFLDFYLALLV